MKPAPVLIFSLLLACSSSFAQYTPPAPSPSFGAAGMEGVSPDGHASRTSVTPPPPNACPVSLRAQHLSDGDLVKTGVTHTKGLGQALHLTVSDFRRGPITEAVLDLRGFTPKGRLSQTAPQASATATRRQQVYFAPAATQSADIWVAGLSAITSVELVSATFVDGSSWTSSSDTSAESRLTWLWPFITNPSPDRLPGSAGQLARRFLTSQQKCADDACQAACSVQR